MLIDGRGWFGRDRACWRCNSGQRLRRTVVRMILNHAITFHFITLPEIQPQANAITDAARMIKLDIRMFDDESWNSIYFGVKRSNVIMAASVFEISCGRNRHTAVKNSGENRTPPPRLPSALVTKPKVMLPRGRRLVPSCRCVERRSLAAVQQVGP